MKDIEVYSLPNVDSSVIDAHAWVHMYPPHSSKAIGDYCSEEVLSPIINSTLKRIDLGFDVYIEREDSLKRDVRMRRGNEVSRFAVQKETPVPKNFKWFLHNEGNKTELSHLIADLIHEKNNCEITIVGTKDTEIIANKNVEHGEHSQCNKEEADTRMFLYVKGNIRK